MARTRLLLHAAVLVEEHHIKSRELGLGPHPGGTDGLARFLLPEQIFGQTHLLGAEETVYYYYYNRGALEISQS